MSGPPRSGGMDNVKVVCRVRPPNQREQQEGDNSIIEIESRQAEGQTMWVKASDGKNKFTFDSVLGPTSTQNQVYETAGRPIIESVMDGYNGTVFAYGQTGSGKTHTMEGPNIEDKSQMGIIPRMVTHVFELMAEATANIEFTIKVSMIEIYLEKIRDLLDVEKTNLQVHEDSRRGVYVDDATEEYVKSPEDVYAVMRYGASLRAVAATSMNDTSSRSHSIFMMEVRQRDAKTETVRTGRLFLVDLAGSEKVRKTNAAGDRLEEAKNINKSLSALGNVIFALTDPKSTHTPYRDSKLTRILEQSLGGNSKTCLVLACSPSSWNEQETLSTLRFGARAKMIRNRATINQEFTAEQLKVMLAQAEGEIGRLKALLESGGISTGEPIGEAGRRDMLHLQEEMLKKLNDKTEEAARYKEEAMRYREEAAALRSEITKTTLSHETEMESVRDLLAHSKRENAALEEKLKNQDQRLSDALSTPRNLDAIQIKDGRIAELEALVELQRNDLRELDNNGELGSHSTSLTELLAHKEVDIEKYKSRIKELEARTERQHQMMKQHQDREKQFQLIIKQFTDASEKLQKNCTAKLEEAQMTYVQQLKDLEEERDVLRTHGESLGEELQTLRLEHDSLTRDFKDKCDKLIELEVRLDQEKDQNETFMEMGGVKNPSKFKQTIDFLQRNLEQYSTVCQRLLIENHQLKQNSNVLEQALSDHTGVLSTALDRFDRLRSLINSTAALKQALIGKGYPATELEQSLRAPDPPTIAAVTNLAANSQSVRALSPGSSFDKERERLGLSTELLLPTAAALGDSDRLFNTPPPRMNSFDQPSGAIGESASPTQLKNRPRIAVPVRGGAKKSSFEQSQAQSHPQP